MTLLRSSVKIFKRDKVHTTNTLKPSPDETKSESTTAGRREGALGPKTKAVQVRVEQVQVGGDRLHFTDPPPSNNSPH